MVEAYKKSKKTKTRTLGEANPAISKMKEKDTLSKSTCHPPPQVYDVKDKKKRRNE
jgi:hypothetical protein